MRRRNDSKVSPDTGTKIARYLASSGGLVAGRVIAGRFGMNTQQVCDCVRDYNAQNPDRLIETVPGAGGGYRLAGAEQ